MKGRPLYPFAITAVLGIGLIIILSFWGLNIDYDMAGENEENDANNAEQFDDPIELGEHVYQGKCLQCHGDNLEGMGGNPAVNALEGKYTADEIVEIIEVGPGTMPGGLASGEEAEAVAKYLLSVSE